MLVLHALWSKEKQLALWCEDTDLPSALEQSGTPGQVAVHPFALAPKGLKFPSRLFGGKGYRFDPGAVVMELPSVPGAPLASPGLKDQDFGAPVNGASARLQPWRVPVQVIEADSALAQLLCLADVELPPNLRHGASFLALVALARLGAEALARGTVLPTAQEGQGDTPLRGEWRPFLGASNDFEGRLKTVASHLPAVAFAERDAGGERPSALASAMDFLNTTVHGAVRLALAKMDLLPRTGVPKGANACFPAWMTSLSGASRPMPSVPEEALQFRSELDDWYRLAANPGRLFRVAFVVQPPEYAMAFEDDEGHEVDRNSAKESTWRVELALQADDDPEELVAATRIWNNRKNKAFARDLGIDDPAGVLRLGLDRAVEVCPELAVAMKRARVTQLDLTTRQAHRFMKETAPRLSELGMMVHLPPWWAQRQESVGLALVANDNPGEAGGAQPTPGAAKAKGKSFRGGLGGALDKDSLVRFQWQVALGDVRLNPKDLFRMAQEKQPLVNVGGKWIELKQDEVQEAVAFFKKKGAEGELGVTDVLRKGLLQEKVPLPLVEFNLEGMLSKLAGDSASFEEVDEPPNFVGQLRDYQKRGLSWLHFLGRLGVGACLADDMGLGKTVQLLALAAMDIQAHLDEGVERPAPTLLICPMSLVGNWQREAERFTPDIRVLVHHGSERMQGQDFIESMGDYDLVLTTYGLALRDRDTLADVEWRRIVLDEAQNIKNPSARQTQAVRSIESDQRVALTGTPVENHLTELWSIMHFLNPGLLGSQRDYKGRFATPIERHGDRDASEMLRQLTGPFILRRLKSDRSIIKELPEKMEANLYCNLTKDQASLYQAVVDDMMKQINSAAGIARKGLILTTLMKLKQVCNHPTLLTKDKKALGRRSGKLARLDDLLEVMMEGDDACLIFTQFSSWGGMLAKHLEKTFDTPVAFLHGGTPKKERDKMVQHFQSEDGPRIFVLSLKAGGVGLNLTKANQIIHYDRWWNPAVEDQASDRAYRIGQKRTVQVRKFVCVGTLEERIDKMIEQKKALANAIIGTGEGWLTELDTDQLAELFKLSQDAVSE
ncbi:MAG: DEAD/DEAH box helicase [Myxococcota bacterium]|nr:DEAD/DEAH box helicase [Myxococcota bacterium]